MGIIKKIRPLNPPPSNKILHIISHQRKIIYFHPAFFEEIIIQTGRGLISISACCHLRILKSLYNSMVLDGAYLSLLGKTVIWEEYP